MDVRMENISKSFSGVSVLKNVHLHIKAKEIHALVGENGAGKSTLMKILTGVYQKDSGSIFIDNRETDIKTVKDSEQYSIAIIHQELNVLPNMSIQDNLFLGREQAFFRLFLKKNSMEAAAKNVLLSLGLNISPNTLMKDLSVGQQQLCEIAKALLMNARLIIMDEPTAALTETETELLFSIIRRLRNDGVSFLYISHRMEEIFSLCDTVTVLRDGTMVTTKPVSAVSFDEIISLMVGYDLTERFPRVEQPRGAVALSVQNLTKRNRFEDVSFDLYCGEILCFAGLMGSGRTELMHALFGSQPADSGSIVIDGKEENITCPRKAQNLGIGFITEDRKNEGLLLEAQSSDNMVLASLPQFTKHYWINRRCIAGTVQDFVKRLHIRIQNIHIPVKNLSGGNQQKVVIAKWLLTNPKILILDEPTRGVDIGAKREIYKTINELKAAGAAIIAVSSELPEVLGIADRVAVMHNKRLAAVIPRNEITQEKIMYYAMGGKPA